VAKTSPNERLADVVRESGLSNKALARLVRDVAARHRSAIGCDHTSVSRWLGGMHPRGRTGEFLAEALSQRLGRTITLSDIGLPSESGRIAPTLGTEYSDTPEESANVLGLILQADLSGVPEFVNAPISRNAWSTASLSWLVRPGSDQLIQRPEGRRVGLADVDTFRTTVAMFEGLDNQFGGGHARTALIQYLRSDLRHLLAGRYTEDVGRRLYAEAAESTLLVAWMSYDAGRQGIAQRYFVQALRFAQASENVLLAGTILDAMSHQATFMGRWREAANLARAARSGTQGVATATQTAHFYAMEARALAAGGDAVGTQRALSDAVRIFERRHPGDDPDWISYFDDSELSAEFGHCYRDIGRADDAVTYARRALGAPGASPRSDFFVTLVLAAGHLGQGEVEEACVAVRQALDLGAQVKSARCVEYLRQLRRRLEPFRSTSCVKELVDVGGAYALWAACGPRA